MTFQGKRKHKNRTNKFRQKLADGSYKIYEYNVCRIRVTKPVKKKVAILKIEEELASENVVLSALLNFYNKYQTKSQKRGLKHYA